ncbi:glycoside hydrolase family 30 protein [Cerasicoccus maritimus]|uniref:glycoside hydrolase family 30 protein n=1 Tax=Cerasicoccus maritimus TaxID=490089 RepID=UPI0028527B3A|nr:glycoside hydrolase family 30 protein [Cerasicoccus maritimus]
MNEKITSWDIHQTSNDWKTYLEQKPSVLTSERSGFSGESVFIDPNQTFQPIHGFGGALTEAAAVTLAQLPEGEQDAILKEYFSPDGHGYSLCRISLNSCDFSLGNYACVEEAGDVELKSFNLDRDKQLVIPFLKKAYEYSGGKLKIMASPWSPPAWMKTTGRMNEGGKLKAEYRQAWANYYVRFIQEYAELGLPIWAITVQNEPDAVQSWDSCIYSAEEERDFVRDHLGPAMEQAGLSDVKIIIWDHNRDQVVHRASIAYSDPEASRYIWGTGFHWYMQDKFDNIRLHHDTWPDKHLIFTEGCQEYGTHFRSYDPAERYARSIIADLNNWTEGWFDWNLLLDETGGPNHVSNFCSAPIIIDTRTKEIHRQFSWYYLGHFSRFIQPGAQRILCATTHDDLEATAAKNPDGSIAVVVLNRTSRKRRLQLYTAQTEAVLELPPRSIISCVSVVER